MNWEKIQGNWKQFRGAAKERWGKLTDDDLSAIKGRREKLEGALQKRYGFAKEKATEQVEDFGRKCGC